MRSPAGQTSSADERVVVAVSGAPGSEEVVRRAAQLAERSGSLLVGVHVRMITTDAPDERVSEVRALLEHLGGRFVEVVGDDVPETLLDAAAAEGAGQLVIGSTRRSRLEELRRGSVVNRLLREARHLDVHVIAGTDDTASAPTRSGRRSHPIPTRRRVTAWGLAIVGVPVLSLVLLPFRDEVGLPLALLGSMALITAVASIGGIAPGVAASIGAAVGVNLAFVPPYGTLQVGTARHLVALAVLLTVGATLSYFVDRSARRSAEAARAQAEARALSRSAAALAASVDPVPTLLAELVALPHVSAASVLVLDDDWLPIATAGDPALRRPEDGHVTPLQDDGTSVLVVRSVTPDAPGLAVDTAIAEQLSVALTADRLRREAAVGEALARTDALRTGILRAVSHDLRTPLAGIKASVTSLLSPDVTFGPEASSEFLRTIDAEADRLDRVVGKLLDMSRVQTGSVRAVRRAVALEEVVAAALQDVGPVHSPAPVDVRVDETLPLVDVDGPLLERALANVIENALAVQPTDAPPVRVTATPAEPGRVELLVVDAGPGIAPEDRNRVVEPFQRVGDQRTSDGVGLGLAIALGFTEAVGGTLELRDSPGGGLTVVMSLPASSEATAS
ncbi:MAG: ATP-binding protein [Microthrixaceae bacterium]